MAEEEKEAADAETDYQNQLKVRAEEDKKEAEEEEKAQQEAEE